MEIKLEDFEKQRSNLKAFGLRLLSRSTILKDVDLLVDDLIQQTYLDFHRYGVDKMKDEDHFKMFLNSCLKTNYYQLFDITRKNAQYTMFKKSLVIFDDDNEEEEILPDHYKCYIENEYFDEIDVFKKELTERETLILNYLLEGYSQREIAEKSNLYINIIFRNIQKIKEKYKNYENTSSKMFR